MFSADDVFEKQALLSFLQALWPHVSRIKGVFRLGKSWGAVALDSTGAVTLEHINYRRDSRIEIIVPNCHDAHAAVGRLRQPSLQVQPRDQASGVVAAALHGHWDEVQRVLLSLLVPN